MADNATTATKRTSKYAAKVASKAQMYGPGCCAHRITVSQIVSNRQRVAIERKQGPREPQVNWESPIHE